MDYHFRIGQAIFCHLICFSALPAIAQVLPDASLGAESSRVAAPQMINGTPSYLIDQGAMRDRNLFHSFHQFNIPTGEGVYFANPPDINHIFARITGGDVSHLDGVLGVLGEADLFLLNPQGILFGPNASLNLGGSFIASTAHQIQFADGGSFSAVPSSQSPSLLSLAVPVGLQMGASPGPIQVQGRGHRLATDDSTLSPYVAYPPYGGLQVQPNQTLALLGGDLNLDGGVVQALGGNVALGSVVQSGLVQIAETVQGFELHYPTAIRQFGSIQLSQQSVVEVGHVLPGAIQIQGGRVNLADGSLILGRNITPQEGGTIKVTATEELTIRGTIPEFNLPSGIIQDNFGPGKGGDIVIQAQQLNVQTGAGVFSRNYGSGPGGNLTLETQRLEVSGYETSNPDIFSRVGTLTTSPGKGGDLFVSAPSLLILEGGFLGTANFLAGSKGGDVWVNSEHITVQGVTPTGNSSLLGANNLSRFGDSGNLVVNTRRLELLDGGLVATASLSEGDAGNLNINASEAITMGGTGEGGFYASSIGSSVVRPSPALQQLFSLPDIPLGVSGDILIRTPSLTAENFSSITVSNEGIGKAGTLRLQADRILLKDYAAITAFSFSGDGGNIEIDADQIVLVTSDIIAAAFAQENQGNGGNINLNAAVIIGAKNSDILASASQGRGGNITITTDALFGFEFRSQATPKNDINASSELGISGNVEVKTLTTNPISSLALPEVALVDPDQQLEVGCHPEAEGELTLSGKGGRPPGATDKLNAHPLWSDSPIAKWPESAAATRLPGPDQGPSQALDQSLTPSETEPQAPAQIIEASTWQRSAQGQTMLQASAAQPSPPLQSALSCLRTALHSASSE